MHPRSSADPRIVFKAAAFIQARQAAGMDTPRAAAQRLGLSRTTVQRAEEGDTEPGPRFIAAVLAAFPGSKFEDFFAVTGAAAAEAAPRDPGGGYITVDAFSDALAAFLEALRPGTPPP